MGKTVVQGDRAMTGVLAVWLCVMLVATTLY